ncbi:type II toxin-antitoxin system VapC family toxin [Candidatus Hodarchaeum mangrovi]
MIDSNIWVYYFDENLPEHSTVVKFLNPLIKQGKIATSTIIMIEVIHYFFKRLGPVVGAEKSNVFQLGQFETLEFTSKDLDEFLAMFQQFSHQGIGGRDITILVCMKKAGISKLVTHDQSFKKIPDFEMIDPIL